MMLEKSFFSITVLMALASGAVAEVPMVEIPIANLLEDTSNLNYVYSPNTIGCDPTVEAFTNLWRPYYFPASTTASTKNIILHLDRLARDADGTGIRAVRAQQQIGRGMVAVLTKGRNYYFFQDKESCAATVMMR